MQMKQKSSSYHTNYKWKAEGEKVERTKTYIYIYITDAFGAIIGLEVAQSCRSVSGDTCAVVAAFCVGAVAPVAADISHILALIVICGEKMRIEK